MKALDKEKFNKKKKQSWKISRKQQIMIEKNQLTLDCVSLFMEDYVKQNHDIFETIIANYDQPFIKNFIKMSAEMESLDNPKKIQEIIKNLQSNLLNELKRIISKHSLYFWNQIEARLPTYKRYSENEDTVQMTREVLRAAILKFGSCEMDDMVEVDGKEVIPKLNGEGIEDLYKAECIAYSLYMTTADLRNLWKGGRLNIQLSESNFLFDHDSLSKEAIDWMDSRNRASAGSLIPSSGIYVTNDLNTSMATELDTFNLSLNCFARPNINHKLKWKDYPNSKKMSFIPLKLATNYLLLPIVLSSFRESIKPLETYLINEYKFSSNDLVNFIIAFSRRTKIILKRCPPLAFRLLQTGYMTMKNKEVFIEDVAVFWSRFQGKNKLFEPNCGNTREAVTNIVNTFTLDLSDRTQREQVDICLRRHLPWFYIYPNGIFMHDYRNMWNKLDSFFYDCICKTSEQSGNKARNLFPETVKNQLNIHASNVTFPWETNKKIKVSGKSGQRFERECDLAFIVSDILFLCECKSRRSSKNKLAGEHWVMSDQWNDSKNDLNQVESLTEFIITSSKSLTVNIPDTVQYICPLVIYPSITWVKKKHSPYIIGDNLPRFCTPQELLTFIKLNDFGSVRNDLMTKRHFKNKN